MTIITLNNGVVMPIIGLGVFQTPPEETTDAVASALEAGYRHIDTAAAYGNEREVGEGIRRSGVPREEIFIETKVWISDYGYEETLHAFEKSAGKLGVEQIDLLILHQALPGEFDKTVGAYKALEKLLADGRVRAIGVSNFMPHHLAALREQTEIVPAVNQVELHPYFPQAELRAYHDAHGIRTESWSPLAKRSELLNERIVQELAVVYRVTPSQLVLRWHVEIASTPIPKSGDPDRQRENADIFGFSLDPEDVAAISALERGRLWDGDPETHEEF